MPMYMFVRVNICCQNTNKTNIKEAFEMKNWITWLFLEVLISLLNALISM